MIHLRSVRSFVVAALLAPYALVFAQELSPADLVKGHYGKYASVLKLDELPDDYSAVHIATTAGNFDPWSSLMPLLGFGRGSSAGLLNQYRLAQVCWSNGDTVMSMHREFLVTYQLDQTSLDLFARSQPGLDTGAPPMAQPREVQLRINLIALDSIKEVSPSPGISKKDLVAAFGKPSMVEARIAEVGSGQTRTLSNIKQAALGLIMYANDYDDAFPYAQDTDTVKYVIMPYTKNKEIWNSYNPKGGRILFNMGVSGAITSSLNEPAQMVLLFESEAWDDGRRAVAFCDGHAKLMNEDAWNLLKSRLKPVGIKRVAKPLPPQRLP